MKQEINLEEILEGNKLIAEFIGAPAWKSYWNKNDKSDWFDTQPFEDIGIHGITIGSGSTKDLYFHSSWNWLMPVVEKIENCKIAQEAYGFEFSIKGKRCVTVSNSTTGVDVVVVGFRDYNNNTWYSKIEATWVTVVEFIKWYNTQEIKIKKLEKKIKNMNKENLFIIGVGLCGGFGGIHTYEVIEADSLEEAEKLAYEASCENYEQYEGLYGLRTVNDIIEEDEVNEEEAEEIYIEERESWLNYIAYSWSKELEDDLKSKYHYTNNLNN